MNLVLTNVGNHLLHIHCSVGYARKSLNDMQDPTVVIQVKSCLEIIISFVHKKY